MISTLLALSLSLATLPPEADESFDRSARLLAAPQAPPAAQVSQLALLERRQQLRDEVPGLGGPIALMAGGAALGVVSGSLWGFFGSIGAFNSLDRGWGVLFVPVVVLLAVASGVSLAAEIVGICLLARNLSLRAKAEQDLRELDASLAATGPSVPLPAPGGALARPTVR